MRIFTLTGQLDREIRLQIEPEPITAEDLNLIKEQYDPRVAAEKERSARSGSTERLDFVLADRNNTLTKEHKAYWSYLIVDDGGYLWLHQVTEGPFELYANAVNRYRVINPEGCYIGDTSWPLVMQGQITRGYLSAIVLDPETGEHVPTFFKIHSIVDGLEFP